MKSRQLHTRWYAAYCLVGAAALVCLGWAGTAQAQSGGVKSFVNKAKETVTVGVLPRAGENPAHSRTPVATPPIKSGGTLSDFRYGDDQNPFINGLRLSWQNTGSAAEQYQQVTTRGSGFDSTLNTNNTITIAATSNPAVQGSNTGGDLPPASKKIVNNSAKQLSVTLLTRVGDDPANHGKPVTVPVPAQGSTIVVYGTAQNPYLNGVSLLWQNDGSVASQSETVTERGSAWDSTLNTQNTLTIGSVSNLEISGSN